jgi:urease accessory protein
MSLSTLLVLADGRLPSGGHAHSGGLEAAVASGRVRTPADVAAFLHGRLVTAGLVAASFGAAACFALSPGSSSRGSLPPEGAGRLGELDSGMDARTPSPALRKASRAQGRALLRAGRAMWNIPDISVLGREPHQPVALGVLAAAAGLGPLEAATAAVHGITTGSASAAVRLLGLDPYETHAAIARLAPAGDRIAADAAARINDPVDDLPAAGAPLLDIGAELHATWEVRLFAS